MKCTEKKPRAGGVIANKPQSSCCSDCATAAAAPFDFGALSIYPGESKSEAKIAPGMEKLAGEAGGLEQGGGGGGDEDGGSDELGGGALLAFYAQPGGPAPAVRPRAPAAVAAPPACAAPAGKAWNAAKHVKPKFKLTTSISRSNTDPATTTTDDPTFTGHPAVDKTGCVWRYQLDSVTGKGNIKFVFYTKDHYPAPSPTDDTGELTNVTKTNWRRIVNDLTTNKNGPAGAWSAYMRTRLHEGYHWKTEWQGSVKPEVVNAENDIAKLSETFAAAPAEADARTSLEPQATAIFTAAMTKARATYNALGDSAGDPPYLAGAKGAVALAKRVREFATAQGW